MKKTNDFSIKSLWRVLLSFWLIICIVTALAGAAGAVYSLALDRTSYIGYASFWVNATSTGGITSSSTMGAAQLASNYVELAASTSLCTRAVKDHALDAKWNLDEDTAVKTLDSMISAGKTDPDSLMFTVYVTAYNKQVAYEAIDAVQQSMLNVIQDVNGDSDVLRVTEVYSIDDIVSSRPSILKKAIVAAGVGFLVSYAACFLYFVLDKRVKRTEQLEEAFDTDVVGLPAAFYKPRRAEKISPVAVMHSYLTAGGMVRNSLGDGDGVILVTTDSYADLDAALSIGESYAAAGKSTLIVECDSRLPMLLDMLEGDKEGTVGIDAFFADGAAPTVINIDDSLDVITVGKQSEDGYLSVHSLIGLVESVKGEYDIVILSLPAADLLVDVVDLSEVSDRSVVVVNQYDNIERVARVHELLADLGAAPRALYFLPL